MRQKISVEPTPTMICAAPCCELCGRVLWPDVTVQGRPPLPVCPSCASPGARFWHTHPARRCPLGYPWPLRQDPAGRRFICC